MNVLHVSNDLPDPIEGDKTKAIEAFVKLSDRAFSNRVISLNRTFGASFSTAVGTIFGRRRDPIISQKVAFGHNVAVRYRAPPKGILHRTRLERLAGELAPPPGFSPDLLVGHKLTVEGFVVHRMARELHLPYALTIQGDTDTKILRARPDLRRKLGDIYRGAGAVVSLAPWSLEQVERLLGPRDVGTFVIPCPTDLDGVKSPRAGDGKFLTVFHLKSYRRKNFAGMLSALDILSLRGSEPRLCVAGGGSEDDIEAVTRLAGTRPVTFEGAIGRDAMAARMNAASAFVLPSLRESFGLVFIEALLAGCPVIYPAGQAISGFFEKRSFAVAVNPRDNRAIAAAMAHMLENEAEAKADLAEWQQSAEARRFMRENIADAYVAALRSAVRPG
ncbi:glycosyltransferase [Aurantiacibacter spongiae]|uniref:Glycosyltransferase n=1 Tax=Aurantiacibacter spongiae TaxID=2488860 RepID=A0A3N5CSE9_9SPHN|nr:glycosyltransferase [Aurantiacibacter spongiae]RPF71517.1 glycosyltransferase [Aurantiacibacter spongiae]